jgi:polyisoprenoid-binding protein YceI
MPNSRRALAPVLAAAALALAGVLAAARPAAPQPPPKDWRPEPFPARIDLIGAEIFGVDKGHSHLGFSVGFLELSRVRGTFGDWAATLLYDDERPERSSVTVVIDAASIDTGGEFRDRDLRSAEFFDVEKHPHIVFRSTRIEPLGGERYRVHGELAIKGIGRPVAIEMTRTARRAPDRAWGNIRVVAGGKVTLKRREFGLLGREFWGDIVVGEEVEVELEIVANRFNYDRWSFPSEGGKPPAGEEVWKTLEQAGAAAAAARFRELRRSQPEAWDFSPLQLGIVINRLMQRRRVEEALPLLAAGAEAYPALGRREEAIAMYEKVQAMVPLSTEAMEMLRRLRESAPAVAGKRRTGG